MKITRIVTVFGAESAFWAGLLGGRVKADEDWHSVIVAGEWLLGVQLAPDHVPPQWPGGGVQQRIHLDVWIDDLHAARAQVVSLGGRMRQPAEDLTGRDGFRVYADPAGHPFCLCWEN